MELLRRRVSRSFEVAALPSSTPEVWGVGGGGRAAAHKYVCEGGLGHTNVCDEDLRHTNMWVGGG